MSHFDDCVKLQHKAEVYVQSTVDVDHNADNAQFVEAVARTLSRLFGGASAQKVTGYWLASNGQVVIEAPTIVYAYMATMALENMDKLYDLAEGLKRDMRQESILVTVDGTAYLV